jgi:hypothetical protein
LDKELIAMSNEKIKKIKVMGFANQHDELKYLMNENDFYVHEH